MTGKFRILFMIWGSITLIAMPVVGTWSVWYPWPPKHDVLSDLQNAVWGSWFWLCLFPTVVLGILWWFWYDILKER